MACPSRPQLGKTIVMSSDLAPRLSVLLSLFPKDGSDVPISRLAQELDFEGYRYPQMPVGTYIARLNVRLEAEGKRVVPGVARKTYRMIST